MKGLATDRAELTLSKPVVAARWGNPIPLVSVTGLAMLVVAACHGTSASPVRDPSTAPAPSASSAPAASVPTVPVVPSGSLARSAVKKTVSQGLGAFLQRVELDSSPVMAGNKFHGFRIIALRGDQGFWSGVEIKPGDVLVKVNGRSVEKPQEAFEVFMSLEKASELRIDFERDGVAKHQVFPIVDDGADSR